MAAEDLTSLAQAKARLEITDGDQDAYVARLITVASQMIVNYLGYDPHQQTVTELRDGTGRTTLVLAQSPVISVTGLAVNGRAVDPAADYRGPGWLRREGTLQLVGGPVFSRGAANIEIVYEAGYAAIPQDLEEGCLQTIQAIHLAQPADPNLAGESVPGVYSVNYAGGGQYLGAMPPGALSYLDRYRRKFML